MRTFIALLPSDKSHRALLQLQKEIPFKKQDVPTPTHKLHLTLVFCGDLDTAHVTNLGHLLITTELTSPFTLQPQTLAFFGHDHTKRLVLELEKNQLIHTLYTVTLHEMSRVHIPLNIQREFKPHITLGKIKSGLRIPSRKKLPAIEFTDLVLFESKLSNKGSTYRPIVRIQFHT